MNSHCHPRSPSTPVIPRIAPEIGEPSRLLIGIATMKIPTTLARCSRGNQYVR